MANNNLTIVDQIKRRDPDGALAYIIESLSKLTPVIDDAVFREGNMMDGHKFTNRNALPPVSRRRINKGTPGTKSGTGQVKEPTTTLHAKSIIDVEELALNGDDAAFRATEDLAFVQSIMQQADEAMLYDNKDTDPDEATGLIPRLDSTAGDAGKQIVKWNDSAGGVNTNASLVLVGWGDNTVHGIFPKGTKAGLDYKDTGEHYVDDGTGTGDTFLARVGEWTMKIGMCVKDKRFIARVCNIDMTALTEGTAAAPVNDLIRAAIKGYRKIFAPGAVKLCWYAPRELATFLDLQSLSAVGHGAALTFDNVSGVPMTRLCGAPVRISDAMTTTEAAVV